MPPEKGLHEPERQHMQKYKPKIRGHQISISEKMLSYVDSSFSPNVVGALVPAVASTLKNAILTFKPVKKPPPTHKQSTLTNMVKPQFLFCESTDKSLLFSFMPHSG